MRQWRETGSIRDRRGGSRGRPFERRYTAAVRLLAEVDEAFDQMSGLATRKVLRRQFEVFGKTDYERPTISNGHVYNLRASATYRAARTAWTKTKGSGVNIGLRQAPEPEGMPGHVRVDTVHQGDRDGAKGIYLINLVTPRSPSSEFVGAVAGISERFLVPRSRACCCPSRSRSSASTPTTAAASPGCSRSCASSFTKSRARHSNDNALVEGKNDRPQVVRPRRSASRPRSTASPARCRRSSTGPACSEYRDGSGRIRRKYLARTSRPTGALAARRRSISSPPASPCSTRSPPRRPTWRPPVQAERRALFASATAWASERQRRRP